jgi:hypothetical protein
MAKQALKRTMVTALASLASLGAARAALANTVHFEAESARIQWPFRGTITSPLMIKDDPAASGGSYVMVAAGNNSPSTAPASTTDGVAKYVFSVSNTGTYRIWARVSTPTNADDSFWIRMGGSGAWIKWNAMVLGAAFHWVQVKPDGATSPSTFNLTADVDNELQVAYREDGTKLDAFFITDSTSFNPTAALTGPPLPPIMQPFANGGGSVKISWSAVPGATSYQLERRPGGCSFNDQTQCCEPESPYAVIASGITGHTFTEAGGGGQYRVTAVAPTGSSFHPPTQGPDNCYPFDPSVENGGSGSFYWRAQVPVGSVTPPMKLLTGGGVGAPAGTNSTAAAPAKGRLRMDFELAAPSNMRMWAETNGPTTSQDSFWVRWDDGVWINWNNLGKGGFACDTLHDSSKTGAPIVRTLLPAGSHRIEWAYREGGAILMDNIILREEAPGENLGEQCSD